MSEIKNTDQAVFTMKHGNNTSERIAPDLLASIMKSISGGIEHEGKTYKVSQLGEIEQDEEGYWRVMFDILNFSCFDHIEFCLRKTGWGRAISTPSQQERE